MPTEHDEYLSALEADFWNEIVAYFEAMPKDEQPTCYKKYAHIREIIGLSQDKAAIAPAPAASPSVVIPILPKARSLTEEAQKEAIHEALAAYYVYRSNKSSMIRDALIAVADQGVSVPGKSPASTLAALISRDSAGRYAKESEGFWHLSSGYYQQKAKEYQGVKKHFEMEKGATSLVSSAPFNANHPH